MKFFPILIIIFILASCSQNQEKSPSERIVTVVSNGVIIGYGVELDTSHIMTATHVIETCKNRHCIFGGKALEDSNIVSIGESSIISFSGDGIHEKKLNTHTGEQVYALRFVSGSLKRFDTKITGTNKAYIGYDSSLSGSYLTGAIEVDMVFSKGESGLPLWNNSGELIGVVSASDEGAGKSYIVP